MSKLPLGFVFLLDLIGLLGLGLIITGLGMKVPQTYAGVKAPPETFWSEPQALAEGQKIYLSYCAVCHGERGDGQGPGRVSLGPQPADFRNKKYQRLSPSYLFWRVSEGGTVGPYNLMPAYKSRLSKEEIWQVIAYLKTFSK
jgi:mono/diheme cytochrome c family protein